MKRRNFLKYSLSGLSGLGFLSALSACSTFDEFIFDEHEFLKDQVLIIGGGISGLYLAQKLRQLKTEFRLFEGSQTFGGRIRSNEGLDFGASVFEQTDMNLKKLLQELNLTEIALSKNQFTMAQGAESITHSLQQHIGGLMPYRSLRLKWRLQEIRKINNTYELIFNTPSGERTIVTKKLVITIPPSQWGRVFGLLELPEMQWAKEWLKTLETENVYKMTLVVPNTLSGLSSYGKKHKINFPTESHQNLSMLVRPLKNNTSILEFELSEKINSQTGSLPKAKKEVLEIENMIALVASTTKLGLNVKKIADDSFFNWSQVQLIQGAYFKNAVAFPYSHFSALNNFQVIGDYSAQLKPHTVEGALSEALRISSLFV